MLEVRSSGGNSSSSFELAGIRVLPTSNSMQSWILWHALHSRIPQLAHASGTLQLAIEHLPHISHGGPANVNGGVLTMSVLTIEHVVSDLGMLATRSTFLSRRSAWTRDGSVMGMALHHPKPFFVMCNFISSPPLVVQMRPDETLKKKLPPFSKTSTASERMLHMTFGVSSYRYSVSTLLPLLSMYSNACKYDPPLTKLDSASPTLMSPSAFSMKLPISRPADVFAQLRVAPLSNSMADVGMSEELIITIPSLRANSEIFLVCTPTRFDSPI